MPLFAWLFFGLLLFVLPLPALAQNRADAWILLKSERIDGAAGAQTIAIADSGTRMRAVRLVMTEGRLVLDRAIVRYGNGQQHYEDRRIQLDTGERTRPIGIHDEGLIVEAVSISYAKVTSSGAITLEVWGDPLTGIAASSSRT